MFLSPVISTLEEHFPDAISEPELRSGDPWITVTRDRLADVLTFLKITPELRYNLLIDLTCIDFHPEPSRFSVYYYLHSMEHERKLMVRVRVPDDDPTLPSVITIYGTANWHEREVYDQFGISFRDHPDLRRILNPDHWTVHPLRRDFPLGGEEVAFTHNAEEIAPQADTWTEPEREKTVQDYLGLTGEVKEGTIIINIGPQHPSTHGVLRVALQLEGETVLRAMPHVGYLHTGIEKTAENLTYQQAVTVTDRLDYVAPLSNNLGYALAVEKLLNIEIPPRADYVRVILAELTRIASHLIWLGTHAFELGVQSMILYCFRERELILDIFEELSGVRMMTSFINVGGVRTDLTPQFGKRVREFLALFPEKLASYEDMLTNNKIWLKRTKDIGALSQDTLIDLGVTGPVLRSAGVAFDVRTAYPYCGYDNFTFTVPTGTTGDVYDKYRVRMEEMRQSLGIIEQALDGLPEGPFRSDDRKVTLPPREEIETGMEQLIHHFLLVSKGFPVPEGEAYSLIESPRGALGFFVSSDGTPMPRRMRVRAPSFVNLQALEPMCRGGMIADVIAIIAGIDPLMGEVDR